MAKNATKTGNNHTVPAKKKGHAALYTALGILVIVAIGAAYLYFTFLSGGILSLALNAVHQSSSWIKESKSAPCGRLIPGSDA